jgi:hypothetical protein
MKSLGLVWRPKCEIELMKISAPQRLAGLLGIRIISIVQDQEVVKTILKYLGLGVMQLKPPAKAHDRHSVPSAPRLSFG